MRLGICAGVDQAYLLKEAGADYIEPGVGATLRPDQGDESTWDAQYRSLTNLPLPVETFNLFIPASIRLVGPDTERAGEAIVTAYVFTALRRAARIGGKVIVFGSGGARRVPEGFSRTTAVEQIRDFLRICAKASEETGIVIAIEPLNKGESNIINTVGEAVTDYVTVLNHPGIRVLGDTYHMELESEPLSILTEVAPYLAHVHTADSGRFAPGTGTYNHVALFRTLAEAGYQGRLSIEARFNDLANELGPALSHLRNAEKTAAI